MNLKIQKLDKSHIDQILDLESHSAPQLPTYYPFDRHELESVTFAPDSKVVAFGAFDGSKLVGWGTYKSEGDGLYQMAGMVIDREYRRQGIGEKLFQIRLDEILAKPDRTKIYTTNYPKNTPIIMLYLTHGFTIEDFKKDVYGPGADRLYLSFYPKGSQGG